MDNVIREVLDIEKRAKEIHNSAVDEEKRIFDEIENKKKQLFDKNVSDIKDKKEAFLIENNEKIKKEFDKIKTDTQKKLDEIKTQYDENGKNWEERMFNNILG